MLAADARCPRERPRLVNARLEGMNRSAQRVDGQRRGDVGRARHLFGPGQGQRQHRRRRLGAVDQRQPFLGSQADRFQPRAGERLGPGDRKKPRRTQSTQRTILFLAISAISCGFFFVVVERLAFTDQHQREVGQRRQVAAGADRAARRHAGVDAMIEQGDQRLERGEADAREAFREHVGAQRHRRPHGADRQRIAQPGGVAAQQVELQRFERVRRDRDLGERTEAGVDAVRRLIAARAPFDHRARSQHALAGGVGQRDRLAAVGDGQELLESEGRAVQQNHEISRWS